MERRDFLKLSALSLGRLALGPETKREVTVMGRHRILDDRLVRYTPSAKFEVQKVNKDWAVHLQTQEVETPKLGEGFATVYDMASRSATQITRLSEQYSGQTNLTENQARIVTIWKALKNDNVLDMNWESQEFPQAFRNTLWDLGISGIAATKSAQDYGEIFNLSIWDPRSERFITEGTYNGETKPLVAVVTDTSTGQTFRNHKDVQMKFDNMTVRNDPVSLAWFGDISREFADLTNLPGGTNYSKGMICRWERTDANFEPVYERYSPQKTVVTQGYIELGGQLGKLFTGEQIKTDGLDGSQYGWELSGATFVTTALAENGIPYIFEDSNKNYLSQIRDSDKVGVPIGNRNLHTLLYQLSYNGALERNILSINRADPIEPTQGIFFIEDVPEWSDSCRPILTGFFETTEQEVILSYFDENSDQVTRNPISEDPKAKSLLFSKDGFRPEKRLSLFH